MGFDAHASVHRKPAVLVAQHLFGISVALARHFLKHPVERADVTTKLRRRLTIARRACYAVAKMHMPVQAGAEPVDKKYGMVFRGCMTQIGDIVIPFESWDHVPHNPFYAPVADVASLEYYMDALRKAGDSCGARIRVTANTPDIEAKWSAGH